VNLFFRALGTVPRIAGHVGYRLADQMARELGMEGLTQLADPPISHMPAPTPPAPGPFMSGGGNSTGATIVFVPAPGPPPVSGSGSVERIFLFISALAVGWLGRGGFNGAD
jgi:hypothetical protein